MKTTKKAVAYVLAFITVFSSFTILPSEFWGWTNVSAVEVATEEPTAVTTNEEETIVEEPTTAETNKEEITVESNKNETAVEKSTAGETYTEGDFTYSIINENEVKIVGYNGTSTEIFLPEVTTGSENPILANKKVTSIGNSAFKEKGLTSVVFSKYLESIEDYAFANNTELRTVDLLVCPNLKTIGEYAFYEDVRMTFLTFPESLEVIGAYAFYHCACFHELDIEANIKKIGTKAFYNCTNLNILNIVGGNHAVIEDYAFRGCSYLDKITIGDGVEVIGKEAFEGSHWLSDITIGNTVTTIKSRTFPINQKSTVTIGTGVTTLEKDAFYCDDFYYLYDDGVTGTVSADIKVYSTQLTNCLSTSFPKYGSSNQIRIYCYKDSATHKALQDKKCGDSINFFEPDYHVTDIKVNGVSIENFGDHTNLYTVYADSIRTIRVTIDNPDISSRECNPLFQS